MAAEKKLFVFSQVLGNQYALYAKTYLTNTKYMSSIIDIQNEEMNKYIGFHVPTESRIYEIQ